MEPSISLTATETTMKFNMNEVQDKELNLVKAEEPVNMAEQDAEMTIYDFDYWVVRDQPPYMV